MLALLAGYGIVKQVILIRKNGRKKSTISADDKNMLIISVKRCSRHKYSDKLQHLTCLPLITWSHTLATPPNLVLSFSNDI